MTFNADVSSHARPVPGMCVSDERLVREIFAATSEANAAIKRALAHVCLCLKHNDAARPVHSPPPCGEGVSVRTRIFTQVELTLLHAPSLSLQPKSDISDFGRLRLAELG